MDDNITEKHYEMTTDDLFYMEDEDMKTEDNIGATHTNLSNMHDSNLAQQSSHNSTANTNTELNRKYFTILGKNVGKKLQGKKNVTNSLFHGFKMILLDFKLNCYKRLYALFGTEKTFTKQDIMRKFIEVSGWNKKIDENRVKVAVKKMCLDFKVFQRRVGDCYRIGSYEAYVDNVVKKLSKYNRNKQKGIVEIKK